MNQGFRPAIVLACAMLLGIPDLTGSAQANTGQLRLTGSNTMAPLMRDLGWRFPTLHPGVGINVEAGDSGRGVCVPSAALTLVTTESAVMLDEARTARC